jgi:multifunctional methyltransferase subunit TRM112
LKVGRQLGFTTLPDTKPERGSEGVDAPSEAGGEKALRDLHTLLLETQVMEGKLVCGNCGHEYAIKEGIANFLLPSHLGEWIVHM